MTESVTVMSPLMNVVIALAIIFLGRIGVKWTVELFAKMMLKSGMDEILINFLSAIAKALLLLLIFVAALNQLGFDTTALIALIGAAGLAVGLALQNSLQNFAAGVMMIIFRPFKLGDFIEAGGVVGAIEQISIFSTIMKTGDNREIIVPNGQIYAGAITNYSARETRRIDLVFGIGYEDDMLAAVAELADSSVNFNVRPWVKSEDYWTVRSELIEQIKLAFDKNNISIPYPHVMINKK